MERLPSNGFFGSVPERPRDDLLAAYLQFLASRNGTTDPSQPYPVREAWLARANASAVRHRGVLDAEEFGRRYAGRAPGGEAPLELLTLLSFVKVNAGEAYGVEVLSRKRHRGPTTGGLFEQVERVIAREETYHTRILVGATRQFDVASPEGGWTPPLPLRVLIGSLAHSPKAMFHPILLAAEVGGVFTFNWMLERVGEVFRDEPALAASLENRLMEILVDELGHIAFNRMAVGPWGLAAARALAPKVAEATSGMTPEFRALGWTAETKASFAGFDLNTLPEEVRRRAFFV